MLDNIWTLLPYFDAGIVAAVVARFTGMNLSMTVLFALLYIGATPVEAVMSMLVFNPFTYFTVYTQQHILGIKDLTFFPGAKMLIPVIVTLALATFNPFVGIIIFIALFLAESFANVYDIRGVGTHDYRSLACTMVSGKILLYPGRSGVPGFCHCYGRIIQSQSLYGNVGLSHVRFRVYFRVDRYYCR